MKKFKGILSSLYLINISKSNELSTTHKMKQSIKQNPIMFSIDPSIGELVLNLSL